MKCRIVFLFFLSVTVLQAESLPPMPVFERVHQEYVNWFVGSKGNGISRMVNVEPMPSRMDRFSLDGTFYSIDQIELVSLLKHDPAMVYTMEYRKLFLSPYHSEQPMKLSLSNLKPMPPMRAPTNYKLRALREDEAKALEVIKDGKNVVMTDAGLVGAIRARTSCLRCHEGKEGDLLGAFSYSLKREAVSKDVVQPGDAAGSSKAVESGTGAGELR